jgi:ADP-ribose pyrophosphatase YjhB (NUDIX family)
MTAEMSDKLKQMGDSRTCPAAFVVRDGKILIGFRHYTQEQWKQIDVWTCPGGRCDEGEAVEKTLRRETAEEIGVDELEICEYLGEVPGAKEGDIVPVFVCRMGPGQEPKLMEPEKFSEWRWVTPEEVPENFINPRGLALVREWLKKH